MNSTPTPLVVEHMIRASAQSIWDAITRPEQMREWYFNVDDFKAEVGFTFRFDGGPKDSIYRHICTVLEVVPASKLRHSWKYDGYKGSSIVTWELIPQGDVTLVRITHEGLDTFPAIPMFARGNFEKGWTSIIGTNLPNYLVGL